MSFSFNFDMDPEDEVGEDIAHLSTSTSALALEDSTASAQASTSVIPHREVPLSELLATLPPLVSYTPVTIPLTSSSTTLAPITTTVLRRDLFDARFQVLSQDDDDEEEETDQPETSDAPARTKEEKGKSIMVDESSDLVKGVYEGGLKTWECSLDLVDCLDGLGYGHFDGEEGNVSVRGKSVLEVGCGTAVPSCFVFATLLREIQSGAPKRPTRLHLQDYNKQVLSLITLPNLLLAYAQSMAPELSPSPETPTVLPGDVEITPGFLDSFEAFLKDEMIELKFFEGDWSGMHVPEGNGYDVVLTSETIYSIPSLPSLLTLLESASRPSSSATAESAELTQCLVACKRIYFGVGGGEHEFRTRVEEKGGKVETVWGDEGEGEGKTKGVGRVVMSVKWA